MARRQRERIWRRRLRAYLKPRACSTHATEAMAFALRHETFAEAWNKCPSSFWLGWMVENLFEVPHAKTIEDCWCRDRDAMRRQFPAAKVLRALREATPEVRR